MSEREIVSFPGTTVRPNGDPNKWWCKSHNRMATHVRQQAGMHRPCCDPGLGGILLPCDCERLAVVETHSNIDAVENILRALEGMQGQVQALTNLVVEQDKRIEKLERRKIIRSIGS